MTHIYGLSPGVLKLFSQQHKTKIKNLICSITTYAYKKLLKINYLRFNRIENKKNNKVLVHNLIFLI